MGDHTETLQVDYDPALISYQELLEVFWKSHNPFRQPFSRQYINILFYHNQEQEEFARSSKAALEQNRKKSVKTKIVPFAKFYPAEDYHQKYYLQNVPRLIGEYQVIYSQFQDIIDSSSAARVNGYIAGYGDAASLEQELEDLGLSSLGASILQNMVQK